MSLPLECPSSPHMAYMGLCIMSGAGCGYNSSGRLTKFYPTWKDNNLNLLVGVDPVSEDQGLKIFQNKTLVAYPSPPIKNNEYNYSLNRNKLESRVCVTALPLNSSFLWNSFPGPLSDVMDNRIDVSWDVDTTTDKVSVYHAFEADHSDAHVVAIYQGNTEFDIITTKGDTEIKLTGIDGDDAPGGEYHIQIVGSDKKTIFIFDNMKGTSTSIPWSGLPVQLKRGVLLEITDEGKNSETDITIRSHIKKTYSIENPISGTHRFMIRAHRFEDEETADSNWVDCPVIGQLDGVSDVVVTFDYATAVRFEFTMPDTIGVAGYRIFLSRQWMTGNDIPHWFPAIDNAATAGEEVSVLIANLDAGTYYFYIRAYDQYGNDDETANVMRFVLQDAGIEDGSIESPLSIKGWSPAHNQISLEVITSMNEDSIKIYSDQRTGTIDWVNPIATYTKADDCDRVLGTSYGKYELTMTGFNDGTYLIGVRCFVSTEHDGHTDNYVAVQVFANDLAPPYSVWAREVVE